MTHSPEPWSYVQDGRFTYEKYKIFCSDKNQLSPGFPPEIAQIVEGPEGLANARIIAAAPEMLEELRNALEFYYSSCIFIKEGNEPVNERVNETERLINKATGVQQ